MYLTWQMIIYLTLYLYTCKSLNVLLNKTNRLIETNNLRLLEFSVVCKILVIEQGHRCSTGL